MNTLKVGDLAPEFCLTDTQGTPVHLSEFRGKRVVLYFYPRDNTPGCTKEACGFRDAFAEYEAQNIVVLGISMDDAKSHQKFASKYQLPFTLLCDSEGKVATLYESYGLKKFMGKEYNGVYRQTFVIDSEGKIERIYKKVKPEAHAAQILADLTSSDDS